MASGQGLYMQPMASRYVLREEGDDFKATNSVVNAPCLGLLPYEAVIGPGKASQGASMGEGYVAYFYFFVADRHSLCQGVCMVETKRRQYFTKYVPLVSGR